MNRRSFFLGAFGCAMAPTAMAAGMPSLATDEEVEVVHNFIGLAHSCRASMRTKAMMTDAIDVRHCSMMVSVVCQQARIAAEKAPRYAALIRLERDLVVTLGRDVIDAYLLPLLRACPSIGKTKFVRGVHELRDAEGRIIRVPALKGEKPLKLVYGK